MLASSTEGSVLNSLRTVLVLLAACRAPVETDEPVSCDGDDGPAVDVTIAPYVQSLAPNEAWILWETASGTGSRVDFGTEDLDRAACGDLVPVLPGGDPADAATQVHEVRLTGLQPGTTYHYRVRTGQTVGDVLHFRTPSAPSDEAPLRLVAMGDSQHDTSRMDTFREVVQDGVIARTRAEHGDDLAAELDLVLLAGDLVDNGWIVDQWKDELFAPAAELLGQVPLYPVPGNHEGNSPHYFRYFRLPDDGKDEHWYTVDRSNLRVIGLDSNPPFDSDEQLAWLDEVLDRTCDDDAIDFVFAQLHHPFRSELWPQGESDFTGEVVARLDAFSTGCGKPSVHFFGHTHAYSRGASRDHQHLWVNVSSAGGALDRWGAEGQANYPEFAVSQDTWGFVEVEVEAGDAPRFTLRRISRGNADAPADNAVTDELTVVRDGAPPDRPGPIGATCDGLRASAFADADGQGHQASHWQVAATCDFADPLVERWRQRQDVWQGVDLQADDDLTDEAFPELDPDASICWRVRYRDDGLAWSEWSEPQATTLACG